MMAGIILIVVVLLLIVGSVGAEAGGAILSIAFVGLIMFLLAKAGANNKKSVNYSQTQAQNNNQKPNNQLTEREKQKKISLIEAAYRHGDLTLAQYDVLMADLTGRKSMVDLMGFEAAMAASDKAGVGRKIQQLNKDADKRIVYNAALGSAVGGLGGTVIGAATAANNINMEAQQLSLEYMAADQKFNDALQRNAGRFITSQNNSALEQHEEEKHRQKKVKQQKASGKKSTTEKEERHKQELIPKEKERQGKRKAGEEEKRQNNVPQQPEKCFCEDLKERTIGTKILLGNPDNKDLGENARDETEESSGGESEECAVLENEIINDDGIIISSLLKRVTFFLEDGEWDRAYEYCERVLDVDPENARAYVGELMAGLQVHRQEDLAACEEPISEKTSYRRALQFADEELQSALKEYDRQIRERRDAINKDAVYQKALKIMGGKTEKDYENAILEFQKITDWKDSQDKISECKREIQAIHAERTAAQNEKDRIEKEAELRAYKKDRRKKRILAVVLILLIGIAVYLIKTVPEHTFKQIKMLLAAGRIKEALETLIAASHVKEAFETFISWFRR